MHEGSRKAIIAAFLANLGIAIAKFIGFFFTGSAGMLAEAVHSVADTGNQALLFLGGNRARKSATAEHPFGYGRERYFWAFVVAVVLFTLGGAFAIYEGVEKLRHPHEPESLWWAVGILAFAIVLESLSFRTARREAESERQGARWMAFIRRSKSPELPVVLLEDTGALIGLVFALVGVVLVKITHNARFDAVGSLAIGLLLCTIAIVLAVEMKGLLIGESATPEDEAKIASAITTSPNVLGIIHLRTEHLGPEELLMGAKVEFSHSLTLPQLADAIDEVERRVRAALPATRVIYIEPDIRRE
ncbi:MAG: cation diffusion facilitator family transporter [Acidimicrobiia bacterium]